MQTQQRASPGLENSNRVDKLTNKLTKPRTEWKEARAGTSGCKTTPSSRCVLEKRLQFLVSHRSGLHPRGWSTWRGLLSPQHPPGRPAAGPADPPVPLRWAKPGRAAHPRTRCQSPRGGQSRGAAPPAATPRAEPRGSPPAPPPQAAGPDPDPAPAARRGGCPDPAKHLPAPLFPSPGGTGASPGVAGRLTEAAVPLAKGDPLSPAKGGDRNRAAVSWAQTPSAVEFGLRLAGLEFPRAPDVGLGGGRTWRQRTAPHKRRGD